MDDLPEVTQRLRLESFAGRDEGRMVENCAIQQARPRGDYTLDSGKS